jgi:hypothetical protein
MREFRDRWVLPISGYVVIRCCISQDLEIVLSGSAQLDSAMIDIARSFELVDQDGRSWPLRADSAAQTLAPVLQIIGLTVKQADVLKDGTLEMAFADGTRLRVAPDPDFEAWEFTGERGAKAVSLPGGEVAVWKAAA